MTVGKDTIQTLLRQRQALKQALLELQEDIASLNETADHLVGKNIRKSAAQNVRKVSVSGPGAAAGTPSRPEADPPSTPVSSPPQATAPKLVMPPQDRETANTAPTRSNSGTAPADIPDAAYAALLDEAKHLSGYYLRHPSADPSLPLAELDAAISRAEKPAADWAKRAAAYQALRVAYRAVAGQSFSVLGINGKTLEDSRISAHILWALPLMICTLTLVIFPLLLLGRTVSLEMFTSDFSTDLLWIFGIAISFLWGAAGALTLLAIRIALLVSRHQYEADIRRSPAMRAVLGGILGCALYALLANWLPQSSIAVEFFLDLGAFVIGLFAWIVFLSLQRALARLKAFFMPPPQAQPVNTKNEK